MFFCMMSNYHTNNTDPQSVAKSIQWAEGGGKLIGVRVCFLTVERRLCASDLHLCTTLESECWVCSVLHVCVLGISRITDFTVLILYPSRDKFLNIKSTYVSPEYLFLLLLLY